MASIDLNLSTGQKQLLSQQMLQSGSLTLE